MQSTRSTVFSNATPAAMRNCGRDAGLRMKNMGFATEDAVRAGIAAANVELRNAGASDDQIVEYTQGWLQGIGENVQDAITRQRAKEMLDRVIADMYRRKPYDQH
jgi:hypothetical protein